MIFKLNIMALNFDADREKSSCNVCNKTKEHTEEKKVCPLTGKPLHQEERHHHEEKHVKVCPLTGKPLHQEERHHHEEKHHHHEEKHNHNKKKPGGGKCGF